MTLEDIFKDENENSTDIFDGFENFTLNDYEQDKKENLEKTLEIENLSLNNFLSKEEVNNIGSEEKEASTTTPIKDNCMQEAFINCSVLGIITAIMGTCWIVNILNCL